jgi:hypothetical protein
VLESIGSVSKEMRDRIIQNLQKARAIRSNIEFY